MSPLFRVRLGGDHQHVGKGAIGDELFLPGDDPFIPSAERTGAGGTGIRTRLRFGEPKSPDLVATSQGWEVFLFLILGAKKVDGFAAEEVWASKMMATEPDTRAISSRAMRRLR